MSNYYDRLGDILKDTLNSDDDPFDSWNPHRGKTRRAGTIKERKPIQKKDEKIEKVNVPIELHKDYFELGLEPGACLVSCKHQWKILLKKHHPDLFIHEHEKKIQSEKIQRINKSYNTIKNWFETGTIP